jgi:hypothetical protein
VTGELVVPGTGEVVAPEDPAQVARALDGVLELARQLHEVRGVLTALLVEEAQRQGTKTLHLPGVSVTISGGTKLKWDVDKLRELTGAGLPDERLTAFLRPAVTYSPDGRVAKQLAGANPEYARIIGEARVDEPAPWRASVKLTALEHARSIASGPEQIER